LKQFKNLIVFLLFSTLFSGCAQLVWGPSQSLIIMTYNVENLFDTEHDEGKEDFTYLPKDHPLKRRGCLQITSLHWQRECFETDWTEEKLELKLSQLARVIKASSPRRPHIVVLTEVENLAVAQRLANITGHSEVFITEGPDRRGIDIAVLLDLPPGSKVVSFKEVDVSQGQTHLEERPTRPLMKLHLETHIGELVIYGNHWPSQGSPNATRIHVAEQKAKSIARVQEAYPQARIVSVGDFNVIDRNQPNALVVLKEQSGLKDAYREAQDRGLKKSDLPPGTYFFARDSVWNHLDRILLDPRLVDPAYDLTADLSSFEIIRRDFMTRTHRVSTQDSKRAGELIVGVPHRANFQTTNPEHAGFSDHFPVLIHLRR
jgi:hypothetical protein